MKFEDRDIILVEVFPCNSKDELHARETYFIDSNICVNKIGAYRSEEQLKEQNK